MFVAHWIPFGAACLLLLLLELGAGSAAGTPQAIWLTSIQPFTGADWDAGISMRIGAEIMLEEVNRKTDLLPGYELKVVWQDGLCSKGRGTDIFLDNVFKDRYHVFAPGSSVSQLDTDKDGVVTTADVEELGEVWNSSHVSPRPVGLLGSGCSGTALSISKVAYMTNWPVVSNSATRPALSDRSKYPNFYRTILPDTFFNAAWVAMARILGHTAITAVSGETDNWGSMMEALVTAADTQGVSLEGEDLTVEAAGYHGFQIISDSQSTAAQVAKGLRQLGKRFVILLMFHPRNRLLMCEAHKLGYINVVWMVMGWLPAGWWSKADTDCEPAVLTEMATGFISANMQFYRSDIFTKLDCSTYMTADGFRTEWLRRQGTTLSDLSMRPEGYAPALEAATTADAVCMYAQMLHEVLINRNMSLDLLGRHTLEAYTNIQEVFATTSFEGVAGTVKFGENVADPDGSVIVEQMQGGKQVGIASYLEGQMMFLGTSDLIFGFPGEVFFAGPKGAATIEASVAHFHSCESGTSLNFRDNICEDCPSDQVYVVVEGIGACTCKSGYETAEGSCAECPPGTFSATPGSSQCEQCSIGRFSDVARSTTCSRCPVGTYAESSAHANCTGCPATFTTAGEGSEGEEDCHCGPGTRLGSEGACEDCGDEDETGLVCLGNGDTQINVGFFAEDNSLSVYKCFGDYAKTRCKGGLPGRTCAPGRRGVTCAECEPGQKEQQDGSCAPCHENGSGSAVFVLACFGLLACLLMLYVMIDRRGSQQPSHSLLLCALMASMAITILQQLSILGTFKQVSFPEPMAGFLRVLQLLSFDVEVLNFNCVVSTTPVSRFICKISILIVCVLVLVMLHMVSVCALHQFRFSERMPSLLACIGTVFTIFYISVVAAVLGPLQCLQSPNRKWLSRAYPSVICWESGEHTAMVVISVLALTLPLAYLAKCCWVVWQFPKAMEEGHVSLLVSYQFLFSRFKPETYWYSLVTLFRSLALAMLPIVPNVAFQLLCMLLVLIVQLVCTVAYMPWRVRSSNYIEIIFTIVVQVVTACAAFYVDTDPGAALAWSCMLLLLATLASLPVIATMAAWRHFAQKNKKAFQYFICHHKAGAGAFARLLKLLLQKRGVKIFIDCDNLTDLDTLFDQVANMTECLVIVGSKELLTRIWCVGEITTAMTRFLQVRKLALPDFIEPDDEFVKNFQSHVDDLSVLTSRGISLQEAQKALVWVRRQQAIEVPLGVEDASMRQLVKAIVEGDRSPRRQSTGSLSLTPLVGGAKTDSQAVGAAFTMQSCEADSTTFIVRDGQNLEASAAAMILSRLLLPHFAHRPSDIPVILPGGAHIPRSAQSLIMLCTSGSLEQENVLRTLMTAEETMAKCLPVVVDDNFRFPTAIFLEEHKVFNSIVSTNTAEADALFQDILHIFSQIAVKFPAAMASEAVLISKASEIADRLDKMESQLAGKATFCSVEKVRTSVSGISYERRETSKPSTPYPADAACDTGKREPPADASVANSNQDVVVDVSDTDPGPALCQRKAVWL